MKNNNMIKISEIIDNLGNKRKVYTNLKVGDKLKAKFKVTSKDDIGMSGLTFNYDAFIPNNIYEIKMTYIWGWTNIGYVADESGSLHFATPELFDIL